jgi:hypothetical protein
MILAIPGRADGWKCLTTNKLTRFFIFNHTSSITGGTRTPAVLIVSNASQKRKHRTVFRFEEDKDNFHRVERSYLAVVDRRLESYLENTCEFLGDPTVKKIPRNSVKAISIYVNHDPNTPSQIGDVVNGWLRVNMRDGHEYFDNLTCERYKKENKAPATVRDKRKVTCKQPLLPGFVEVSAHNH